jgi:predicted anti-sigma-YlaC factor YlaD
MLSCRELTEIVTDYAEGRMSFWRRLEVQLHLGMCHPCRAYLRQMRLAAQTVGQLPPEPMPPDVKAELLKRFAALSAAGDAQSEAPAPGEPEKTPPTG